MEMKTLLWIMTSLIIVILLYLDLIYIFSKSFRSYPCYLNIILSSVIAIDNILRLIGIGEEGTAKCYFQAFTLAVFDKLIFTSLTINAFLTYIGVTNYELYTKKMKILFIGSNIFGLFIGLIFGIIFITIDSPNSYDNVCYVKASVYKETSDTIITFCLFLIYLYCNIKLLIYLVRIIKELFVTGKKTKDFSRHFFRIFFSLIITSLSFFVVILIINDSLFLDNNLIDLFYIIICLIVDLFYTFNKTVIKETIKLLCCKNKIESIKEDNSRELDNEADNRESLNEDND